MSNLPNYDELVAVRLELSRIKDQREALEKTLQSDIMKIVRSAITQAADEVGCMSVELDDVKAENARLTEALKEEVDRKELAELRLFWLRLQKVEVMRREPGFGNVAFAKMVSNLIHQRWRQAEGKSVTMHNKKTLDTVDSYEVSWLKPDIDLLYGMDPLVREAVESYKLTKHEDDVRRGLRPEKGGQS